MTSSLRPASQKLLNYISMNVSAKVLRLLFLTTAVNRDTRITDKDINDTWSPTLIFPYIATQIVCLFVVSKSNFHNMFPFLQFKLTRTQFD